MPNQVLIARKEVCTQLYFLVKGGLRVQTEPPSATMPHEAATSKQGRRRAQAEARQNRGSRRPTGDRRARSTALRPRPSPCWASARTAAGRHHVGPGWRTITCLGLYPVWVVATKKTMLLSITQIAIAEALEASGEDVAPLSRASMMKQRQGRVAEGRADATTRRLRVPRRPL